MAERYNQGFGKFGPMEQCGDGEWVRWDDACKVVKENREQADRIIDSIHSALKSSEKMLEEAHETIFQLQSQIEGLKEVEYRISEDNLDLIYSIDLTKKELAKTHNARNATLFLFWILVTISIGREIWWITSG